MLAVVLTALSAGERGLTEPTRQQIASFLFSAAIPPEKWSGMMIKSLLKISAEA